jgi:hypothetical protein
MVVQIGSGVLPPDRAVLAEGDFRAINRIMGAASSAKIK